MLSPNRPLARPPGRMRLARRSLLATAATGGLIAGLALGAGPAAAAPCAGDLTVAGTTPNVQGAPLKVTGADCAVQGDGSVKITNPRLGNAGGVELTGQMTLAANRTQMIQDGPVPIVIHVGTQDVIAGALSVKDVEVCDLEPATAGAPFTITPNTLPEPTPEGGTEGGSVGLPQLVNCRLVPGIDINAPNVLSAQKTLGLGIAGRDGKVSLQVDDTRGGRVVGLLQVRLPIPEGAGGNNRAGLGFLVEYSASEGLKLIGGSAIYPKGFTIPGTNIGLRNVSLTVVPAEGRFGASAVLSLPRSLRVGGSFQVANGELLQLGGIVALPAPGVPVLQPPLFFVSGFGFNIDRTGSSQRSGVASVQRVTTRFTGTIAFRLGDPAGAVGIGGPVNLSFGGPTIDLSGEYCLITLLKACTVKFGNASVSLTPQPFRLEAQHSINALEGLIVGSMFGGATLSPFHLTVLGNATLKVPDKIPFIGGTTVANASAAVSDRGAGGVVRINNPFGDDFFIGPGIIWSPFDIKILRGGVQEIVTVSPSTLATEAAIRSHGVERIAVPRGGRGVIVEVVGRRRTPRSVRITGIGGSVRATPLPGRAGAKRALFVLRGPIRARSLSVQSPDAIRSVRAAAIAGFPYLEPQAGYGTRERPPVTAGTPVRVCWKVPNAQRGLKVDLLEDQNGRLGTGVRIAADLPLNGCFDVPTAGLEPGRHWVYGVIKGPDGAPVWARYWPIGITVVDPGALAAPTGVAVAATPDGARVSFDAVEGASFYQVRAEPTEEGVVLPIDETVEGGTGTEVSLRGARRWSVTVQAIGREDDRGNISAPAIVEPTQPVVVSGTPNGLAEIGEPWAFKLDVGGLTKLRLVSGPPGARLQNDGLLRWTPTRNAIAKGSVTFSVEGCVDARCVTRAFEVNAYDADRLPLGPIRGFRVLQSVVKPGDTVTLIAQGVRGPVRVEVDGRRVAARIVEAETVSFRMPRVRPGSHDISLRIGRELEETVSDAVVVR